MEAPSMVHRSGNTLIVRSVVSGNPLFVDSGNGNLQKTSSQIFANNSNTSDNAAYNNRSLRIDYDAVASPIPVDDYDNQIALSETKDEGLPQCKIKRNYSCSTCSFFTQNPRHFLMHLRDSHGEKIVINECKLCLYASRHYQKLVRHMKMVHGSTEGIEEHSQARKRQLGREQRKRKIELENVHTQSTPASPQIMHPLDRYEEPISVPDETPQNRLLKCSVCEFTTLYRAQLVDHEQEEHYKTKFFRCEKCSYVTHIKARFSKHVKYHSMPMIKCVTCDFRTPYKWNLDRHMKNHGGTGPYKCAACNFTADIKQSLTVHEMNHHVPPVGHAAGMSMARRKNKVGATDIPEELLSENGDLSDAYNNNNNVMESFEEPYNKKLKIEEDDQPTDLSQKSSMESLKKQARPIPNLIPIQAANNALNLTKTFYEMLSKSYMSNNMYMYSEAALDGVEPPHLSPSSSASSSNSKKKSHNESLASECNYMSRYASEAIHHQKTRCRDDVDKVSSPSPINLSVNGSTRCQHCRHRCKSSNDLIAHLKNCPDAGRMGNESLDSLSDSHEKNDELNEDMNERSPPPGEKHPMENKVFVWNNLPQRVDTEHIDENEEEKLLDESNKSMDGLSEDQKKENSENSYYGVETAPGYGEMTPEEEAANSSLKKVYKCPHCSFWASTASRFHVHIVGHLNKKPFECSLCNYRSNWRWDITKHIRLKTIRDPNHKNAKVLMNDETGRRNYTKYNKYITLMKVTEEDGDPKLMKSGEMTPNQEATLSFLNGYKQESEEFNGGHSEAGSSKNMSALDISRMMQMSFFQNPLLALAPEQAKRSPSPLIKPSEDIVTQNIEMKADGTDKRTLYKCRKCDYKNASREMVLSHVKRHYQEAGINFNAADFLSMPPHLQAVVNSSNYMKNVVAAMCLSQQQQLASVSGGDPNSFQNPHSMLATTSLATNTGPKRHCRLKHNGDIRIETIDRNSDKDMPVYYPLNSQPPTQAPLPSPFNNSSSNVSSTVPGLGLIGSKPSTSGLAVAKNLTIGSSAQSSIPPTSDLHNHKIFGGSFTGGLASNHIEGGGIRDEHDGGSAAGGGTKPRQQQCPLCPFVSESKSQMMYHNSLHKCKSDFYQCQICDFNCSKKQLFNQHMKISHDHKPDVEIDLSASNENLAATQALSFCPRCPARYIGSKELNLHLKMHTAKYSHRCGLCSYTALQEPSLLTHSTVHSMSYDEKTVNMLKKFVEDVHYPRPKLTMISLSSGDQVFVVERNTDPDFGDPMKTASVEETAGVDQKPSLLKQQLESNGSDSSSHGPDYPDELPAKKCPQCPFETTRGSADLKSHMNHHIAVSQKRHPATCLHCDFSVSDEQSLKDHVVLHFKSIKNNDVAFYTSYENVELNLVNDDDDEEGGDGNNGERKSNCRGSAGDARSKKIIIFKGDDVKVNGLSEQQSSTKCTKGNGDGDNSSRLKTEDSSDIDDKTIVVATTGELIKIRSTSNM